MVSEISESAQRKLETAQNIWIGTVRPDGRPHLVPVWFVWSLEKLYVCIEGNSVKARNLMAHPQAVLALEDGSSPVICEGRVAQVERPFPEAVVHAFKKKYDWDIRDDAQYQVLVEVHPEKWLVW